MDNKMDTATVCSICGNQLTAFGSKVLKDGVICRDCAKLASKWYDDEAFSKRTVTNLKNHLEYREKNGRMIARFKGELKVNGKYSLYVDSKKKTFLFAKKDDIVKENADILKIALIKDIAVLVQPYEDSNNVDVIFEITLKRGQIRKVSFRVNDFGAVEKDSEQFEAALNTAHQYMNVLLSQKAYLWQRIIVKGE